MDKQISFSKMISIYCYHFIFFIFVLLTMVVMGCDTGSTMGQANAQGMDGTQGPSGVIKVLGFEDDWTLEPPANELTDQEFFPTGCRTEEYQAGPDEVAVASLHGYVGVSGPSEEGLRMSAALSQDNGPFERVSTFEMLDGFADGAAQVSTSRRIPLTEGATYVFGMEFRATSTVTMGISICQGTVLIAREGQ